MPYDLGVDLGTTYTAAAVSDDGRPEVLALGNRALQVPSVLFVTPEGDLAVGEAAERRGATDPNRLVREFKRRIGDTVPILVGGMPFSAQALMARLVGWVVDAATERQGEPPRSVTLTHPANWGPFKTDLFEQAIHLADLQNARMITEPEAAAVTYASRSRLDDGDRIAVYDLGGGTFDAAVLQRDGDGFRILGTPEGIEHLGGVDFDEAIFRSAMPLLEDAVAKVDRADPGVAMALTRLRRDCVEAKEALSSDTEAVVPIVLPGINTSVHFTRGEFEALIRVPLGETVAAMTRVLRSADTSPDELRSIVLMGGSSRIPLVSELLVAEFGRPLALDAHPKHDVALGAALVGAAARSVAPPPPPPPPATAPVGADETGGGRGDEPPAVVPPPPNTSRGPAMPTPLLPAAPPTGTPSRKAIAIGAASVLGLLLAVVAAFLLLGGGDGGNTTATTTSSSPPTVAVKLPTSAALTSTQLVMVRRVDGKTDVYMADVNDVSATTALTSDGSATGSVMLSPNRETVGYIRRVGNGRVVWAIAADGTGGRALFDHSIEGCESVEHVSWDPSDVDRFVVSCRNASKVIDKLLVVDVHGNVIRQLDTGSMVLSDPTISPDGTQVAYWADKSDSDGGSIFTIAIDGSESPEPLTNSPARSDADPAWNPDGSAIAFRRRIDDGTKSGNLDIYFVDVDTREVAELVEGPAVDQKPQWSPAGDQVVFSSNRTGRTGGAGPTYDLWVMRVDGGDLHRLGVRATSITAPAWSHH